MSLLEKMLAQKKATLQSMANQMNVIDEISSQSNNLLLEVEAERSKEVKGLKTAPNMKAYKYNKKIDHVIPKAIELHEGLHDDSAAFPDKSACQVGFADYLQQTEKNNQYLSNNVRKAVAVADILQKINKDEQKNEIETEDSN